MTPPHQSAGSAVCLVVLLPHAPILVPPVGGARSQEAAATVDAMRAAARRVVQSRPQAVVLVSPHSPRHPTAFGIWMTEWHRATFEQFGAPEAGVNLPNDPELAAEICSQAKAAGLGTWPIRDYSLDHGALVPLWHLTDAGWCGPTVILSLNHPGAGGLKELGQAIAAAAARLGRRIAVVASGDMSHRLKPDAPAGYDPRAKQFDRAFIETVRRGVYRDVLDLDPDLQELAAEDVVDSTVIGAAAAGWSAAGHEVLSYEGPFGVGYGVAVLFDAQGRNNRRPVPEAATRGEAGGKLPGIARAAVAAALQGGAEAGPEPGEDFLRQRRAVFVTIRETNGALRGCVGTLAPKFASVAEETWRLAREAAFHDGRFDPVRAEELPGLRFEVSVLQPLEEVASAEELDPRRFGLVVRSADGRRGALLPGIAGVRTVLEQVDIAKRKAGIAPGEPVKLARFEVEKFCEPDFVERED